MLLTSAARARSCSRARSALATARVPGERVDYLSVSVPMIKPLSDQPPGVVHRAVVGAERDAARRVGERRGAYRAPVMIGTSGVRARDAKNPGQHQTDADQVRWALMHCPVLRSSVLLRC